MIAAVALMGCSVLAQNPAADTDASPLSEERAYLYTTADPYGRQPSQRYPDDAADYYLRLVSARELRNAGNCAEAAPLFDSLVREYQDDGTVFYELGACQAELGQYAAAARSLEAALALGASPRETTVPATLAAFPHAVMTRVGLLYAEDGDREQALVWMERGLQARSARRPHLSRSPEAASLLGDDRFAAIAGLPPEGEFTRDEQWRYDIAFLRDQAALMHFDPDHHTSARELERTLEDLSVAVPDLTDKQIIARIGLFMGKLGAGHDILWPVSMRGSLEPMALRLYAFSDGLYIIEAEDESLIGARIDAFGDTPTEDAYRTATRATARDNNMGARWWTTAFILSSPDMLEALGVISDAASLTLSITDAHGERRTLAPPISDAQLQVPTSSVFIALAPPPLVEPPLYLSQLDSLYWTRRLDEQGALYVQINSIEDAPEESFAAFAARVQREASDPSVDHIILDLRHCPGGADPLASALVRALLHVDAAPDKGELYVLIGRNSWSATTQLLADLDRLGDPVFVGEPSGSRLNFIGRVGPFMLPFSKLAGSMAGAYAQTSYAWDHRIWIAPEVPVALSSEDFFAGRDPVMDAVVRLIAAEG